MALITQNSDSNHDFGTEKEVKTLLFQKVLSQCDVKESQSRLLIPRAHAISQILSRLDESAKVMARDRGAFIEFREDLGGQQFKYLWTLKQWRSGSYVIINGWNKFVKLRHLQAGCRVKFLYCNATNSFHISTVSVGVPTSNEWQDQSGLIPKEPPMVEQTNNLKRIAIEGATSGQKRQRNNLEQCEVEEAASMQRQKAKRLKSAPNEHELLQLGNHLTQSKDKPTIPWWEEPIQVGPCTCLRLLRGRGDDDPLVCPHCKGFM